MQLGIFALGYASLAIRAETWCLVSQLAWTTPEPEVHLFSGTALLPAAVWPPEYYGDALKRIAQPFEFDALVRPAVPVSL